MARRKLVHPSIFNSKAPQTISFGPWNGTVNTSAIDFNIEDGSMAYAQNFKRDSGRTTETRDGIGTWGNYLGATTGCLGGYEFLNVAGTQEQLLVYNTAVHRYVSGVWTALTSVTMTTNKRTDGCFFPFTNKFYIINQTDNVVKYTSGAAGDQTDATFKKGKYICTFENRLFVAGVSTQENRVWYTDNQVDTFGGTNYVEVDGKIIGMEVIQDRFLIFTNKNVYRLYGFTFDGTTSYASKMVALPTEFGGIVDFTIVEINNKVYFLGVDSNRVAAIYSTDGFSVENISETRLGQTLDGLAADQLENAVAVAEGTNYRLWVPLSGTAQNNFGITYDTQRTIFLPFETRWVNGIVNPSCAWTATVSGKKRVFIGSQVEGQVYILANNEGGYDVIPEEKATTYTTDYAVDGNPAKRVGQSFKLSNYNSTQTLKVDKIAVNIKKNAGTTTDIQCVIRSTSRTGTVVGTSATVTALTSTTYVYQDFTFSTPIDLLGNTTYYLEIKHVTEGSGTSQYFVGGNSAGTYTNGQAATYATGSWTEQSAVDLQFRVYVESIIDSYLDSKAKHPAGLGFSFKGYKFHVMYGTDTSASLEVGFALDGQTSFTTYQTTPPAGGGATWGGGGTWGGGLVWGSATQRVYEWQSTENMQGHSVQSRVRNRQPNKRVFVESVSLAYQPKNRMQ